MLSLVGWSQDRGKNKAAKGEGGAEQQIAQLEDQAREAALKGDTSFQESHLASDYVRITPDGRTLNRQEALDLMKSGNVKYSSIEVSDRKIHVYGNAAVVTAKASIKGTMTGNALDGESNQPHMGQTRRAVEARRIPQLANSSSKMPT
jgi:hypothetical protein